MHRNRKPLETRMSDAFTIRLLPKMRIYLEQRADLADVPVAEIARIIIAEAMAAEAIRDDRKKQRPCGHRARPLREICKKYYACIRFKGFGSRSS